VLLTILLIAAIVLGVGGYNRLVRARNQVREAWSGIDVQLGRRASLIPNLVETVRGYTHDERETLELVIRARGALQAAGGAHDAANANEALSYALSRLFAVVESYPQLRASETFSRLQTELSEIEEKIAYARQFYNRTVWD
jgi:LemA protein